MQTKTKKEKANLGFSLIELLVAISFIAVIVMTVVTISAFDSRLFRENEDRTRALFWVMGGIEAARTLEWTDLAAGEYHPVLESGAFTLLPGSDLLENKFTRRIIISDVYRENESNGHAYGAVVEAGTLDPDTKKITSAVEWTSSGRLLSQSLESYVQRWQASRWSQGDWSGGSGQSSWADSTKFLSKDVSLDVSNEGVATLLSGYLDWNNASTTAIYSPNGTATVRDIDQSSGRAYLVTNSNSSGDEFYVFDASNIYQPLLMDGYNANANLTGVKVSGDYAYISSAQDNAELRILNIADPYNVTNAGTVDISGTTDAIDVAIDGTEVYILRSGTLYAYSVVNPANPQFLDSITVDNNAVRMALSEDKIYIATRNSTKEFQVFDITNPANLDQTATYDLLGNLLGTDIAVRGARVYMGVDNNSSGRELFIFDISDPANPDYIGDYEVGSKVNSVAVTGPYALVGTNNSSEELIVLDASFPATINKAGGFNLDAYLYAMAASCNIIYGGSSSGSRELLLFASGSPDCDYADFGTLESSTFDTGSSQVVYNWVSWEGVEPLNTDIRFQIATSNNQSGPFTFYGPDGTQSSYYTNAVSDFINYTRHLNQRYVRYKLYLSTTDDLQGPILEAVTISYSTYP